jgi:hypothetical protein
MGARCEQVGDGSGRKEVAGCASASERVLFTLGRLSLTRSQLCLRPMPARTGRASFSPLAQDVYIELGRTQRGSDRHSSAHVRRDFCPTRVGPAHRAASEALRLTTASDSPRPRLLTSPLASFFVSLAFPTILASHISLRLVSCVTPKVFAASSSPVCALAAVRAR